MIVGLDQYHAKLEAHMSLLPPPPPPSENMGTKNKIEWYYAVFSFSSINPLRFGDV